MNAAALLVMMAVTILGVMFLVRLLTASRIGSLGQVVYNDDKRAPNLQHRDVHLFGRPDAIVRRSRHYAPVEYKSGRAPRVPYSNHVLQLASEGLLVEAKFGSYPKFGYLVYGDKTNGETIQVKLGRPARALVLETMDMVRSRQGRPQTLPVDGRCRSCPALQSCRLQAT